MTATAAAALAVFVVAGGLMFMAFWTLVSVLGAGPILSHAAGAVMGILTGGLIAGPLVQRFLRLLRSPRRE